MAGCTHVMWEIYSPSALLSLAAIGHWEMADSLCFKWQRTTIKFSSSFLVNKYQIGKGCNGRKSHTKSLATYINDIQARSYGQKLHMNSSSLFFFLLFIFLFFYVWFTLIYVLCLVLLNHPKQRNEIENDLQPLLYTAFKIGWRVEIKQ